jgi:hypothetical protein
MREHRYIVALTWTGNLGTGTSRPASGEGAPARLCRIGSYLPSRVDIACRQSACRGDEQAFRLIRSCAERSREADDSPARFCEPRVGGGQRDAQVSGSARPKTVAREDRDVLLLQQPLCKVL